MKITYKDNGVYVTETKDFDIKRSCECGQCFRFDGDGTGYVGVVKGHIIKLRHLEDGCFFEGITKELFDKLCIPYFDLNRDYGPIVEELCKGDPVMAAACSYGRGIRLYNQDTWESLISFIISQNNNIPRIKGIIARLCELAGNKLENGLYSFPGVETLINYSAEDLAPIRAGFRAKYIEDAAKKVYSGEVDLEALITLPYEEAKAKLMTIKGVGPKVADCVLLFGAGHIEAFPRDVWIKRAMAALYPENPEKDFGNFGGIAQQYLFVYARENKLITL